MTLKTIREKARDAGLRNITRFKKEHLIRAIQTNEGNTPCFKGIPACGEHRCLWREDCQS
jgi:hypothetical protein